MDRKLKILLACGFLTVGIVGVAFAAYHVLGSLNPIEPTIGQSSKPLDLETARKECPIKLPDGASKIQYAEYSMFVAYSP